MLFGEITILLVILLLLVAKYVNRKTALCNAGPTTSTFISDIVVIEISNILLLYVCMEIRNKLLTYLRLRHFHLVASDTLQRRGLSEGTEHYVCGYMLCWNTWCNPYK